MYSKVLVKDDNGCDVIKEIILALPVYEIDYVVSYWTSPSSKKSFEGTIVGISTETMVTPSNEIVCNINYMLDNGDIVPEDEIEYFSAPEELTDEEQAELDMKAAMSEQAE